MGILVSIEVNKWHYSYTNRGYIYINDHSIACIRNLVDLQEAESLLECNMSFWRVQLATTALILSTILFVHHVQCSGVTVAPKMRAHPIQISQRQANPTDEDIVYCESIEKGLLFIWSGTRYS